MTSFSKCVFFSFLLLVYVEFSKGDDSACWAMNGRCQYTSVSCGKYKPGYCSGPTNRQCCVIGADRLCSNKYLFGKCQDVGNACLGGYVSNLCGGGNNRRCCRGFGR